MPTETVKALARVIYAGTGEEAEMRAAILALGDYLDEVEAVAALNYVLSSDRWSTGLKDEVRRVLGKRHV